MRGDFERRVRQEVQQKERLQLRSWAAGALLTVVISLGWINATEMQRVEKWRQVITALKQESSEANKD
jgi:hypothetical protein